MPIALAQDPQAAIDVSQHESHVAEATDDRMRLDLPRFGPCRGTPIGGEAVTAAKSQREAHIVSQTLPKAGMWLGVWAERDMAQEAQDRTDQGSRH